jgi:hypothetical protein
MYSSSSDVTGEMKSSRICVGHVARMWAVALNSLVGKEVKRPL